MSSESIEIVDCHKAMTINASFQTSMDAKLWGSLQDSVPLEKVFARLPLPEFFRLRGVCKDWNQLACERRCFSDKIQKPYFITIAEGPRNEYLNGILTYSIGSGQWSWKRLHPIPRSMREIGEPFAVEGMIFSAHPMLGVFNMYTRTWQGIPPPPLDITKNTRALGLTVDTSVTPYTFRLILGSFDLATQIYDSKSDSWERKSSLLCHYEFPNLKVCLYAEGHMYIWSQLDAILVYATEDDIWSTLKAPPQDSEDEGDRNLGAWQGRLFTVLEAFWTSLSVWVLDVRSKQEWRRYEQIPTELYKWLRDINIPGVAHIPFDEARLRTCFSDGYLIIYCWVITYGRADRVLLFNIDKKVWEKVALPSWTVSTEPEEGYFERYELSESDSECYRSDPDFANESDSEDYDHWGSFEHPVWDYTVDSFLS